MAASRHPRYRQIPDPTISGRQAHQDADVAVSGRPGCRRIGEPESIKRPADLESIKAPGSEIRRQPVTGVT
ncbi:hypothetical protein ABZ783_03585 [Micromonospora sp. NPDC047738]|uniref:hypothetical protein n=1 Tax=Micromonospora sp. NPDC047738 TaxID=3155741 RepID=UPI0033F2F728